MTVAQRQLKAVNRELRARLPIRSLGRQFRRRLGAWRSSPMAIAVVAGLKVTPKPSVIVKPGDPGFLAPVESMEHFRRRVKGTQVYR